MAPALSRKKGRHIDPCPSPAIYQNQSEKSGKEIRE
jgi:hypothetical protein